MYSATAQDHWHQRQRQPAIGAPAKSVTDYSLAEHVEEAPKGVAGEADKEI